MMATVINITLLFRLHNTHNQITRTTSQKRNVTKENTLDDKTRITFDNYTLNTYEFSWHNQQITCDTS